MHLKYNKNTNLTEKQLNSFFNKNGESPSFSEGFQLEMNDPIWLDFSNFGQRTDLKKNVVLFVQIARKRI